MIAIQSSLDGQRGTFNELFEFFNAHDFAIGGNWDIDGGFFDLKMGTDEDEGKYYFLRIPGIPEQGNFGENDAIIRLGTPFLLVHHYQNDQDDTARYRTYTAVMDQFASPVEKDAPASDEWVRRTEEWLRKIETEFPFG